VINHQRSGKFRFAEFLEILFFAVIIGAFLWLIPLKSRGLQSRKRAKNSSAYLASKMIQTGESWGEGEPKEKESLAKILEWSDQVVSESEQNMEEIE